MIQPEFRAKNIQIAREKLNVLKMSTEERLAYDRFLLARASYQDELQSAEQKGREEGVKEGQQEIARQMLKHGEPLDKIKLYTGLSEAELAQIQSP